MDLDEFLINRSPCIVAETVNTLWEIEEESMKLKWARKTRMQLLEEASSNECVTGCNGEWLLCANKILVKKGISPVFFSTAMKELLLKGCGKNRNLLITGNVNCGKKFLLNPLTVIYDILCNPGTGSFTWVGVDKAECIFLNDFWWCSQLLPWDDLLLMLEGHVVHLPDISLVGHTQICCTGKSPHIFIKNGVIDHVETDMMAARWLHTRLHHQIPQDQQREIPQCAKCFSLLILFLGDFLSQEIECLPC